MNKVFEFLKDHRFCTVATVAENMPRASVLDYYMAGNAILFSTSPESIKAKNLAVNNRISMSVCSRQKPQFVTLDGYVTTPTADEIEVYHKKLLEYHPDFAQELADSPMSFVYFKIIPETIYYNDYSQGTIPTEIIKV